ncbi:YlcI/YnfO family protein [Hafnia paralvei]|uniref:YlcI/YnfO family protein n=1 Tax=Hafnia paralvei TaxID=546367 RepID=UPI003C46D6A2
MATPNKNTKSQLTTVRVPHDVFEGMESVKQDGESNAGFIVAAMRGEIARRQLGDVGYDALASAVRTLASIADTSDKAAKDLEEISREARQKIEQLHARPKR